ncbi:MAG: hypothetical protein KatS3mg121_0604 [Gammaproteobacteria bacterium]|nr:MAG: hypothetical protein KatS3mg121_0604 [Gammaproteobacteria bacterium]
MPRSHLLLPRAGEAAIVILLALAAACAPVKPWQRGTLARPQMAVGHPIDDAFDDHVYFSKEAASGGRSFAGGGCGCN